MKEATFSNIFSFRHFLYEKYHYTDNSAGAPFHYFAYMEKGRCKIVSERGTREFAAGDVFYIPMGLKYQSYWYGDPGISFRSYAFTLFPDGEQKHFCLQKVECEDEAREIFRTLPVEETADCFLLGRFYTAVGSVLPGMRSGSFDRAKSVYKDALAYLSHNPGCTVPELAKACNVSPSLLYAVFQKVAGKTPNGARQEILVDRAVQLLITTDRQVQEISDALGFSSPSYFRKILREHTGKTPGQIRRELSVI